MKAMGYDRDRLSIRVSPALRNRLKAACVQLGITTQEAVLAGLRLWASKVGMPVLDLEDYRGPVEAPKPVELDGALVEPAALDRPHMHGPEVP